MQEESFWRGKLTEMVDLLERQERGEMPLNTVTTWLTDLKYEVEARRLAEAQAQYEHDAMITRLMFEMNRLHAVELLEEMNRVVLDRQGRVEPVYTTRHELCLSWAAMGGRHQIRVGAEYEADSSRVVLIVTGLHEQRVGASEDELKKALVKAFREPNFDIHRW